MKHDLITPTLAQGGRVTGGPGYMLSRPDEPDAVDAPDVSFIREERLPPLGTSVRDEYQRLAPDLAVAEFFA